MAGRNGNVSGNREQILVLYCTADLGRIEPYTVFLQEDGRKLAFGVFYEGQDALTGELKRTIAASRNCILFLSDSAVRCRILPEAVHELAAGRTKLLCVYLDEIVLSGGLSLMLDSSQAIHAWRDVYVQDSVEKVRETIRRMLTDDRWGGLTESVTWAAPDTSSRRGFGARETLVLCLAVLFIAAAVILVYVSGVWRVFFR